MLVLECSVAKNAFSMGSRGRRLEAAWEKPWKPPKILNVEVRYKTNQRVMNITWAKSNFDMYYCHDITYSNRKQTK